ncbi:FadR/GntR family transcriptional regulator [Propionibacteriaceae bacterium G1746]|uniref:FadR/GntR family transcriptional regulator n=1 Tax=Aestuariimicrobium sp. G57 TaxID=3418485 RepID=UPI003C1F1F16
MDASTPEGTGHGTGLRRGFEIALGWVTDEILGGRVQPGDRLPAERDLAAQLGVSRGAVREAMRALQAQGVITSQVGHVGGNSISQGQGASFGRILRLHLALQSVSYDELTETRVLLERAATGAAATAASADDLDALGRLSREMAATPAPEAFNALDTRFHVGIAQAAQNRLIRDLTIAVREAVASHILGAEQRLGGQWTSVRLGLVAEHDAILAALRDGDAESAARLAEEHVRGAHRILLQG